MKLLFVAAALGLVAPAFAADSVTQPPAQEKKDCQQGARHACKAVRARQAKPASGTFREEHGHIATAPMAPSPPPPAG